MSATAPPIPPSSFPPSAKESFRAELFTNAQLGVHAKALAGRHKVSFKRQTDALLPRLEENEAFLKVAYERLLHPLAKDQRIAPAAEWLIDNFYLIEEEIRTARRHLPQRYSRELPHLVTGPAAGLPRIYHVAYELIVHLDGRVDGENIASFIAAYQQVTVLKLGELWAVPIMLRLALLEYIRHIAVQIVGNREERDLANAWAGELIATAQQRPAEVIIVLGEMARANPPLSSTFVSEMSRLLQSKHQGLALPLAWLEQRVAEQTHSLEQLLEVETQAQAADQISMGNCVAGLRTLGAIDWRKFVESSSQVEKILQKDPAGVYPHMDFATRDHYRHAVEDLAIRSERAESEVAQTAVTLAANQKAEGGAGARQAHVGYYLVDQELPALEKALQARLPLNRRLGRLVLRFPLTFYVGLVLLITGGCTWGFALSGAPENLPLWAQIGGLGALVLCTSHLAIVVVNWMTTLLVPARSMPRMDFSRGIPPAFRTMVTIPTMLDSEQGITELLEDLEVRFVANQDKELSFALLTDFRDAAQETMPEDKQLVDRARQGIERLNAKYQAVQSQPFFLIHRPRRWNEQEKRWMGHERKRGKLEDFNGLIQRGETSPFATIVGDPGAISSVRFVITIDTDTELPREAARQLVATMAHPLVRPIYDPGTRSVTHGYGVLQPRVAISLPSSNRSWFARLFSGEPGIDPYTRLVSDVYQDLFGEGSFIGKGIYEVEIFGKILGSRFPEERILSHDLLEGCHVRTGLVSDVQFYEDYPANYTVDAARRHRWIRGDWQIASWMLPRVPGPDASRIQNSLSALSRWKIFDNLRRSLLPAAIFCLLLVAWISFHSPARGTFMVLEILFLPAMVAALVEAMRKPEEQPLERQIRSVMRHFVRQIGQLLFTLCFLPYDMSISLDAIGRTFWRLIISHRNLLEWQTASDAQKKARGDLAGFFRLMMFSPTLAILLGVWLWLERPPALLIASPILGLWLISPVLAWWASRPIRDKEIPLNQAEKEMLEKLARRTWSYFETLMTVEDNFLPPDNIQEQPVPATAHRTSPTNMGLGLTAILTAHDFGYLSTADLIDRLGKTLATMEKLERYRGHFYNWYDTRTLAVLPVPYISTVDSGNLTALLLTLRQGLLEIMRQSLEAAPGHNAAEAESQAATLQALADRCGLLAQADYVFLFDEVRKQMSIGYNVADKRRDLSFYDLLASEARLASFVAIALRQLPQEHWFALGRRLTAVDGEPVLLSWSGSMFEYLMPMLVMPSYPNTLLDLTCRTAVKRQIQYGKERGVPWGISESGYNATDAQLNYLYRSFGVPGLGFKRSLADDLVIAPYASIMALMVDAKAACKNIVQLESLGMEGRYGLYEAIDYTTKRSSPGENGTILRSFMAHHQGMSLLALSNVLLDRPMQRRFLSAPIFRATDLLLQERIPDTAPIALPQSDDGLIPTRPGGAAQPRSRIYTTSNTPVPEIQLLSNGRYHVMVSASGSGYSRWGDLSITRWREDPTRDCWGTYCYIRDLGAKEFWSATHHPSLKIADRYEANFQQARAEFRRRDRDIATHLEVSVSPEDDVEWRRITLTNHSRTRRLIELTSYAEVVLAPAASDTAHPVFSNLFVQTEIIRPRRAIVCTRRARADTDTPLWMFHMMVVENSHLGEASYETDRAKFIGRGRSLESPAAMAERRLSNSEGAVLDPMVSVRQSFLLEPEQTITVGFVTGVAKSKQGVLELMDKYQDIRLANRVFEMAFTHSQIVRRQLNVSVADDELFGQLIGSIVYANRLHRAEAATLAKNRRTQAALWGYGISGDLPIVLLRASVQANMEVVGKTLQAHAYWRLKGVNVDLVICVEDISGYRQELHDQIIGLINASPDAHALDRPGGVFVRKAEQMSLEDYTLLQTVARIVFSDTAGTFTEQVEKHQRALAEMPRFTPAHHGRTESNATTENPPRANPLLSFFNGLGGFTPDGREYIITTQDGQTTPTPWVNVIANPRLGFVVSESGSMYTWAENAHEYRLTSWSNDPVGDGTGEAYYIRDDETGEFWSPTPLPARGRTSYTSRHGIGYSIFEHTENGLYSSVSVYADPVAPVKFVVIKIANESGRRRHLSLTGYWEWVLGESREKSLMHVMTEIDPKTQAVLARNRYHPDFPESVAFVGVNEPIRSITGDRTEFLGRNGALANPAALARSRLSGRVGVGFDSCAGIQVPFELADQDQREIVFVMGAGKNTEEALALAQRYRTSQAAREALEGVWGLWNNLLAKVNVETPDPALNILANVWLPYQVLSCRMWGRSGFYQSGGAYGFRDQLQDAMALVHHHPQLLRDHLLLCASRQFREGDVQHWWHPPGGRGVRTKISDDMLWLPLAVCRYVKTTGDTGVLEERVPYLEGRGLKPDEESYYDKPNRSEDTGSLYQHCVRAIEYSLKFGSHGLPLMGAGDWNDGMNLVGKHGRGESVWLAFFLLDVLHEFSAIATHQGDASFNHRCLTVANQLLQNIETNAWDGGWYRRAYFDDGTPLGSATNQECQIDSLPQSWSVISQSGNFSRQVESMNAVYDRLVKHQARLIQLFDPPFDKSPLNPGYVKGYLPGVRENGGQYTHAAVWTTMAFALMGDSPRAWELFNLINPLSHGSTPQDISTYQVEPYVVAADVYGVAPHTGRGGWTWYTGSAGWMYRLIVESLLGVVRTGSTLRFDPCLPDAWKGFKISYYYHATCYHIEINRTTKPAMEVMLDGITQTTADIPLVDDQAEHHVKVTFPLRER